MSADEARARILARLSEELQAPVPSEVVSFARHLARHFGPVAAAIVFYGSCLRSRNSNGLIDFYVLVDDYRAAISSRVGAAATRLLPPAVYHHVLGVDGRVLHAKVAVVTLDQLAERVQPEAFDTTFWARFCQPLALVHVREAAVADRLLSILSDAVVTAGWWAAALGPAGGRAEDYWKALFRATYAAELRAERADRAALLWAASPQRYSELLPDAWRAAGLENVDKGFNPLPSEARQNYRSAWRRRRWLGKLLNVARLIKAAFTFEDGADYLVWKIERHAGHRIALTPFQRQHPVLAAPSLLWHLLRARIVR